MAVHDASPSPPFSWGRSVGLSALVFALLAVTAALWLAGRPSAVYAPGGVALSGFDYGFNPNRMTWRAGEQVTLTFTNDSSGVPGKKHELMLGRGPIEESTVFGPRLVGGFETDFFEGVEIEVLESKGLSMLMPGDALVSGYDMDGMQMGGMEGHGGPPQFMLLLDPAGRATIRFRVPNKRGRWEFGCFQQSGQHYTNGMRGVVTVAQT